MTLFAVSFFYGQFAAEIVNHQNFEIPFPCIKIQNGASISFLNMPGIL